MKYPPDGLRYGSWRDQELKERDMDNPLEPLGMIALICLFIALACR